jgi:hypothetical protein
MLFLVVQVVGKWAPKTGGFGVEFGGLRKKE